MWEWLIALWWILMGILVCFILFAPSGGSSGSDSDSD